LSRELVLDLLHAAAPVGAGQVVSEPALRASEVAAADHRAAELAFQSYRASRIERFGSQRLVAPSSLSHTAPTGQLVDPDQPDPPPEPDSNNAIRRLRKGRGASALGRAVHAVLQVIDLASLAELQSLAESAARDEQIPALVETVIQYVENAAASDPVGRAVSSGRYWREVPLGILQADGAILEGAIDLLYEHSDGSFGVVDYKTDQITESQVETRAEGYRLQAEAYARAVGQTTGRPVTSLEFAFAALHGRAVRLAF
jgi:ATP-dependent exoDNAse (exonuclease V) beta subunit